MRSQRKLETFVRRAIIEWFTGLRRRFRTQQLALRIETPIHVFVDGQAAAQLYRQTKSPCFHK